MSKVPVTYKRTDMQSDQEVKWCPGCGDYTILASVQNFMAEMGISKEKIVFVSGIGCAARFPYYMNTYGVHSIHGRAPAVATGVSVSNPDLSVWVVSGDGDSLSIGGNHLIHALSIISPVFIKQFLAPSSSSSSIFSYSIPMKKQKCHRLSRGGVFFVAWLLSRRYVRLYPIE